EAAAAFEREQLLAAAEAGLAEARRAAEAELGRVRVAGDEEQRRLAALAAEELERAEARVADARASLDAEAARAAALETDLHTTGLEYEATVAELFVTGARGATSALELAGAHEPLPAPRILVPGDVLDAAEPAVAAVAALDAEEAQVAAPDELGLLLAAPVL